MAVLDDPHEPRLRLGAAQTIKSAKSPQQRFLDDVIRVPGRPGQPPCITVCGVKVGHDESLEPSAVVIHGTACRVYSPCLIGPYWTVKPARELLCFHHRGAEAIRHGYSVAITVIAEIE
jgi:hypothetical protein